MSADPHPDPCTDEARELGCTCTMSIVHSNDIDPPEPVTDPWCPVHGYRDADRELEELRDDGDYHRYIWGDE